MKKGLLKEMAAEIDVAGELPTGVLAVGAAGVEELRQRQKKATCAPCSGSGCRGGLTCVTCNGTGLRRLDASLVIKPRCLQDVHNDVTIVGRCAEAAGHDGACDTVDYCPACRGNGLLNADEFEALRRPEAQPDAEPAIDWDSIYKHGVVTDNLDRLRAALGLREGKHTADSIARIAIERLVLGRSEATPEAMSDFELWIHADALSDDILCMVHAFSDEGRREEVRKLAEKARFLGRRGQRSAAPSPVEPFPSEVSMAIMNAHMLEVVGAARQLARDCSASCAVCECDDANGEAHAAGCSKKALDDALTKLDRRRAAAKSGGGT